VVEPDRQGVYQPTSGQNKCKVGVVDWKARERKKTRKRGTHRDITLAWGTATCCASSGDSERRKGKEQKRERTKTHFPCMPMGALKPLVSHIAAPI